MLLSPTFVRTSCNSPVVQPQLRNLPVIPVACWRADVNTPVCCPSRSEYLSGRYHHNIRDDHYETEPNGEYCSGDEAVGSEHPCGCMHVNSTTAEFEGQTYANYMQQAGYITGYFGKYLNPPVSLVAHRRRGH